MLARETLRFALNLRIKRAKNGARLSPYEYKAGNQAARYLVGFGAGKTKVVAHVKFTDTATNQVVFEDNVDGKVVMGLLGGSSPGATRGLAKEVASKAVSRFF